MRILWIVNTVFPDLSIELGIDKPVVGGWMYGLAKDIVNNGVTLMVVTARPKANDFNCNINGIEYHLLGSRKNITEYDASLENKWPGIIEKFKPDVVHIHGTEYAQGLTLVRTYPNLKYVISIQGLIGPYARYFTGQISNSIIYKNLTFRDIVKRDSMLQGKKHFIKRGLTIEKEYFRLTNHVIGRTSWDRDHSKVYNPERIYHFCNESLRDLFYSTSKWNIKNKIKHSIFLSQAGYPIKGLHQILKAINLVKDDYPDFKIRIAGQNIIKSSSLSEKLKLSGYGQYIKNLINEYKIQDHVEFTGPLNEESMVKEYLKCHVFVCPSSIENSPNSVGEAQLLGVPCIASYVGGIPDMIEHDKTGFLYRFEEVEMLAELIKRLFNDSELALRISSNAVNVATKRHDRINNLNKTLQIYRSL